MSRSAARLVCAWCGRDLGESKTKKDSHGVCPRCKERMLSEYGLEVARATNRTSSRER